jgi:replicative DNA helicase
LLTSHAGVDGNSIRTGKLNDEDKAALVEAANSLPLDRLHLTDRSGTTTADVRWTARRLQRQGNLDLVVIDYLQRLTPADPRAPRHEQVGQMSGDLKRLTLELGVPVLCLAQLNRQSEAKGDHRPRLAQLKASGDIEQDADVVILLHREEVYSKHNDDAGKAELIVAKNRSGPEAEIALTWDGATTTFSDRRIEWDAGREF